MGATALADALDGLSEMTSHAGDPAGARAGEALNESEQAAAWAEGRTMTAEQTVAYVLEIAPVPTAST